MNVKLLIDGIVRQTTVLIAQLSTTAGVRAPLAHIADQVFLSLSREIEAQGVGRKVVADMFGLALRGYQKKTQRLTGSETVQGKTLFEAVLQYIDDQGGAARDAVLTRFGRDGERETIGVLTDLVSSGLLYATGKGSGTLYGVTSEAERQRLTRTSDLGSVADMAWGAVYRNPGITLAELGRELGSDEADVVRVVDALAADGRVTRVESEGNVALRAAGFQIPVGAEHGWESAVFDHFQAMAGAIAAKLRLGPGGSSHADIVGGTTLRFELSPQHPHRAEVLALLQRIRDLGNEVWEKHSVYNDAHPISDEERFNVCVYFGQSVDDVDRATAATSTQDGERR